MNQPTASCACAVTLIQRFGSAANLNIHLHCLVLDGVYRTPEGVPVFHTVHAPTAPRAAGLTPSYHQAPHEILAAQGLPHRRAGHELSRR